MNHYFFTQDIFWSKEWSIWSEALNVGPIWPWKTMIVTSLLFIFTNNLWHYKILVCLCVCVSLCGCRDGSPGQPSFLSDIRRTSQSLIHLPLYPSTCFCCLGPQCPKYHLTIAPFQLKGWIYPGTKDLILSFFAAEVQHHRSCAYWEKPHTTCFFRSFCSRVNTTLDPL